MAGPGDPNPPEDEGPAHSARPDAPPHDHADHDDRIGFVSSASLTGRERTPPAPESRAADDDDAADAEPELPFVTPAYAAAPVRSASPMREQAPAQAPAPPRDPFREPSPVPAWAVETPPQTPPGAARAFGRKDGPAEPVEGAMGLYAVYALILFAVPTLGVSALVALLAVTGRPLPEQALARSHFIFQQRTLWVAAIAALLGVILIAVNLGVFVLFIIAVWVVVRGAWGVLTLKAGKTIADPRQWLILARP